MKIFLGALSEIGTPGTLAGSHGNKKNSQKISHEKIIGSELLGLEVIWVKTLIWGFKRSFLSPCSFEAFYDRFSPKTLLFAKIPPKPNCLDQAYFFTDFFSLPANGFPRFLSLGRKSLSLDENFCSCIVIKIYNFSPKCPDF